MIKINTSTASQGNDCVETPASHITKRTQKGNKLWQLTHWYFTLLYRSKAVDYSFEKLSSDPPKKISRLNGTFKIKEKIPQPL